jgi:hypothetical protein
MVRMNLKMWLLAVFVIGGCTPLPYISPPIRGSIGLGPVGGERVRSDTGDKEDVSSEASISARFSLNPLSMIRGQEDRGFDLGLGYVLTDSLSEEPDRALLHGPYLEVAGYFLRHRTSAQSSIRLGLISRGDLLLSSGRSDDLGWGISGGLVFEFGTFLDGETFIDEKETVMHTADREEVVDVRPSTIGIAYGETSIGVEVVGGWSDVGTEEVWHVMCALVFRLPVSAGVHFVYWDEE